MECRRAFVNAQSQLPQRMYVAYVHILRVLNYLYTPRFEVLTVVLLIIRRRVGGLVVPGGWKERAVFIFKRDIWTE
jgi:hypothetical protein